QQALADAKAELNRAIFDTESILENMSSGIVTVDADGIVRHWNRAASEIAACPVGAMRGRPYVDAFGPGLKEFTERLREALEQGTEGSSVWISIGWPNGTKDLLVMSTI